MLSFGTQSNFDVKEMIENNQSKGYAFETVAYKKILSSSHLIKLLINKFFQRR